MDAIALVEIENLTYAYPGDGAAALEGLSLSLEPGEFVLLAGASGCGKSTLLRAMAALVPHFYGGRFDGRVRVAGRDTREAKPAELAGTVGLVFQDPEAQSVATGVEAEVAFGLENLALCPPAIAKRVEETLVSMGISALRGAQVAELSGGELQKVALAAVLAMQPELLLLDEPTSQLDPVAAESLLASLRRINEEIGTTIILAEHRMERCYHWADRVLLMESGRIVCDEEPRTAARLSIGSGRPFVPPISRVFDGRANGNLPLTVKEGRALLAASRRPRFDGPAEAIEFRAAEAAIEVSGLHHIYPNGTEALRGCDLIVRAGEFVALMGENGAGKSTLVRHFNGLLRPQRGRVKLRGRDVDGVPTEELARTCGLLGQNPNDYLFSETVRNEIEFTVANLLPEEIDAKERIDQTLDRFGLSSIASENPRSLSAGERQRVALASILVAEPGVVVLDEPTRGMDYVHKERLGETLRGLQLDGTTVVVVTHDVEFAAQFADRVILMGRGRIIADGSKYEVMDGAVFLSPQVNKLMRGIVPRVLTVEEARAALGEAGL